MKMRFVALALTASVALPAAAQETYVLDPVHSQPGFETLHLGYSHQLGAFTKSSAKVTLDREAKKGRVEVTIDAASVRTFDATKLDAVVKGEKYLNVEKFPEITFRSSDVRFDGDRVVAVAGELTMLGVSKPVTLDVVDFHCGPQPFNKKPMCIGNATATIKRSDFGMTAGIPFAPADEVVLRLPFEGYRVES